MAWFTLALLYREREREREVENTRYSSMDVVLYNLSRVKKIMGQENEHLYIHSHERPNGIMLT
jgi:hypothetical protein